MRISSQFNKFFHAHLNDILLSGKTITVSGGSFTASIDTKIATLEQLKMFFKMTDVKYKKISDLKKYKNVFKGTTCDNVVYFFGIPLSMTELSSSELVRHLEWIEHICYENKIETENDSWSRLMEMADKY